MQSFQDESGQWWVASAREERTPRHHGRWYLVFHPDGADEPLFPMPEVRWQTRATAARTLRTMSGFELMRRLHIVRERALLEAGASADSGVPLDASRGRTSANAG